MRRLLLAALLALPARPARARSQLPAPEIPEEAVWLNARGLSMARLKGRRVVLVAFFNTANINSLRALEALKAWDKRYALEGLMVLGVHAPGYGFQKDPALVRETVKKLGIEFPVVLDNEGALWKAYSNDGWPSFYLVDYKGRVVSDHYGEGGYEDFEYIMQAELEKLRGSPVPGGLPSVANPPPQGGECGRMTPEVDLGKRRGKIFDLDSDELSDRLAVAEGRDGEVSTRGRWAAENDDLKLDQQNADLGAWVRVIFRGNQAFAVLGPGDAGGLKFWVRQDDNWLDANTAGKDIAFDEDGRSYVQVKSIGIRELVRNPVDTFHELTVIPMRIGGRIYAFSFNNRCLKLVVP